MDVSNNKAVFYKCLHEVLLYCAEQYKDIESMNSEILTQPCLEDSKDIEKNLSRTAVSTITAIYLQVFSAMKTHHGIEHETMSLPQSREQLIEMFVKDAVMAFNFKAVEEICSTAAF